MHTHLFLSKLKAHCILHCILYSPVFYSILQWTLNIRWFILGTDIYFIP